MKTIVEEYRLDLNVKLVPSAENKADILTRVPKRWLCRETEPLPCGAVTVISEDNIAKT